MRTSMMVGARCAAVACLFPLAGCDGVVPCGDAVGTGCPDGSFCNLPSGFCDSPVGVCTPIPDVCSEEFDPVCGCDGDTYANACFAMASAVNVAAQGECDETGAQPGAFCGGIAGVACADGAFCLFEPGSCGAGDQGGECMDMPEACTAVFDPVCGCDGETYANECFAWVAGASVAAEGECE